MRYILYPSIYVRYEHESLRIMGQSTHNSVRGFYLNSKFSSPAFLAATTPRIRHYIGGEVVTDLNSYRILQVSVHVWFQTFVAKKLFLVAIFFPFSQERFDLHFNARAFFHPWQPCLPDQTEARQPDLSAQSRPESPARWSDLRAGHDLILRAYTLLAAGAELASS